MDDDLFYLNGNLRVPTPAFQNADALQRTEKSATVIGLYSPSLGRLFDPALNPTPVAITGVDGQVVLNIESADFAGIGGPGDAPWDGASAEASSIALAKRSAQVTAEVRDQLQGRLRVSDEGAGYAAAGVETVAGEFTAVSTALETFTPLAGRAFNLLVGVPGEALGGSTVVLERALDGVTFHPVTMIDGAVVGFTTGVNLMRGEDQAGVPYRLRCSVYGGAPVSWAFSQ